MRLAPAPARRAALAALAALSALALAAACGSRPAPRAAAPAAPAPPPPAPPARDPSDPSPWPCAMSVFTWTPDGVRLIGELPWSPPQPPPLTPWYIEPTEALDAAELAKLVAALRTERIPGLSLRGQAVAAHLGALRELPDLRALVLEGTDTDGAALAAMDVSLERLYLARTPIDTAAAVAAAARHPQLQVLDLEDTAAGDAAAKAIAALPELRALNLAGTRLTDAGGAELRALAKLEIVDLGRTLVGARTVAALSGLPIRELFLDRTRVGKELASLSGFAPGLRRFDVSNLAGYKPTDADVAWLARAPELVEIGLSGSRITDKLAIELAKLPELHWLRLADTPITLAAIAQIAARGSSAQLADLGELDLGGTPVDDAQAIRLLGGPRMRILRLDRTPITDAALTAAEPGLALRELYLSHTKVTDTGLALLDRLPGLHGLGLGEVPIGAPTLARIAKQRELRTLVLTGAAVPREALDFRALPHLEALYLDRTRAGDETIAQLAPARYLRVLHVANTDVTDAALPTLRALTLLEELSIGDTQLLGAVAHLDAWPRLSTLSLLGLPLGDAILPALAQRRSLSVLDLSSTNVTDPAPLAALPGLRVLGLAQLRLSKAGLARAKELAARGVEVVR